MFNRDKWKKAVKTWNASKIDPLKEREHIANIIKNNAGKPIPVILTGFCCDTGFYSYVTEMEFSCAMDFVKQREASTVSSDGPGYLYLA